MNLFHLHEYSGPDLHHQLNGHKRLRNTLQALADLLSEDRATAHDMLRDTIADAEKGLADVMSDVKFRIEHIEDEMKQRQP